MSGDANGSCCLSCEGGGVCEATSKSLVDPTAFDGFIQFEESSDLRRSGTQKNFRPVRKINFQGLDISIEHDKGDVRHWTDDATGEEGSTKMSYPYGYICRTDGADGEQIDAYIGPDDDSDNVYIVHQMKKPGFKRYDEDKVLLGFGSPREAKSAYLMNYNNPKFFGSMTQTTIKDFKRMFVKKSELLDFQTTWNKAIDHGDLDKGLLDKLSTLWGKVKDKFGGSKDEPKPKKKWVRNTSQKCKTGVCVRLDGTEIDIDDTFTAMKGMQVDGPPAHTHCKCTLEFSMGKALNADFMPEPNPQPAQQVPQIPQPMMKPFVEPHDVETFEGVQSLLNKMGSVKDPELMEIASKIWGKGYNYEGKMPSQARAEILGFLLDQRDLLGVEPEIPELQPSPSLPVKDPYGSSNYSGTSIDYGNAKMNPSPEETSSEGVSRQQQLQSWFEQDYWKKPRVA